MRMTVTKQFKISQPPAGVSTDLHLSGATLDVSDDAAAELEAMGVAEPEHAKGKTKPDNDADNTKGKK